MISCFRQPRCYRCCPWCQPPRACSAASAVPPPVDGRDPPVGDSWSRRRHRWLRPGTAPRHHRTLAAISTAQPTPLFAAPPLPMRGRSLRQLRRTTAATADCHRCRRRLRPRHPRCRCQPHRQRRCHYLPTLQLSTCRPKLHHHLLFNGAYSSRRRLRNPTSPGCQHRCVGLPPSSTHLSLQLDSLQPGVCPCSSLQHADICAAGLQPALILSASQPTPPQPCSRLDSIAIPRALPQAGQLITAEVQAQSRCHRGQRAPAATVRLRAVDRQRTWIGSARGSAAHGPTARCLAACSPRLRSSTARRSLAQLGSSKQRRRHRCSQLAAQPRAPDCHVGRVDAGLWQRCPPRTEIPHGRRLLRPALVACVDPSPPAASPNARFADPGRVALLWLPLALPPPPPPTG